MFDEMNYKYFLRAQCGIVEEDQWHNRLKFAALENGIIYVRNIFSMWKTLTTDYTFTDIHVRTYYLNP